MAITLDATDATKLDNRVIKSRIVDKYGNETIEYYSLNRLPDSAYSSSSTINVNLDTSAYRKALASSTAPVYSSSLTGAYAQYTQAIASADSTLAIDNIYVYMQAWMAAGTYVGQDTHTNPPGTTSSNMTAFLQIPANPFNYQFGSAYSQHVYTCTGYQQVSHSLSWKK